MKYLILVTLFSATFFNSDAQPWKEFHYQTGDLLFQDLDCGPLCDAIEAVSPAYNNRKFSHIGLVYVVQDSVWVIEAIGKAVQLTRLKDFMLRQATGHGAPKVLVGRISQEYAHFSSRAVGFALEQMGKPYDDAFIFDNDSYYCSELIYDSYKAANSGKPFFEKAPMTFKDPVTRKTFPAWTDYYTTLNIPIPEGQPGCNPGSIANDEEVEIVTFFY